MKLTTRSVLSILFSHTCTFSTRMVALACLYLMFTRMQHLLSLIEKLLCAAVKWNIILLLISVWSFLLEPLIWALHAHNGCKYSEGVLLYLVADALKALKYSKTYLIGPCLRLPAFNVVGNITIVYIEIDFLKTWLD